MVHDASERKKVMHILFQGFLAFLCFVGGRGSYGCEGTPEDNEII